MQYSHIFNYGFNKLLNFFAYFSYLMSSPKFSTLWQALLTISTFCAVIISLYLANRTKKKKKILLKTIHVVKKNDCKIILTILNVGDLPVIIDECGLFYTRDLKYFKHLSNKEYHNLSKKGLDTTYNKYIVSPAYKDKIIKAGDAAEITYSFKNFLSLKDYNYLFKDKPQFAIRDTTYQIIKSK